MHAAGGHLTSTRDLARWALAHMNDGVVDGERIFPAAVMQRILRDYTAVVLDFDRYHRRGYGLGWYIGDYHPSTLARLGSELLP